ncbi:MAG: low specificity L-threonine aldolase [Clostridia bacterium]|nr:low specificity L-threonine aldolase [Clostridia bacterium]
METAKKLCFASDYMKGAHPAVLARLVETNMEATSGYGMDPYCEEAKDLIRRACGCPGARVEFLVGGTQTNATVIDALLRPYQGVIAAQTGHIATHEAGAIEAGGHKVLPLPQHAGKLDAREVHDCLRDFAADENHEHMVMPGMVYISHPTEYGTLYTKSELQALRAVCDEYGIPLYLDGARLAYALACPQSDVTLADLAQLCDVFYIGGTKCGALFGEAVVIPKADLLSGFFTLIKQHGALLAKGRLLGLQFGALFTDSLYEKIGAPAIRAADTLRDVLAQKGYTLCFGSPTNQVFCIMENTRLEALGQHVEYSFWEKADEAHTVIRFATDWATTKEDVEALSALL